MNNTATTPRELLGLLLGAPLPADSRAYHRAVARRLRAAGWSVRTEVRVPDRGDGRTGRIDIVAAREDGRTVAIELDRSSPRRKSLYKLRHFAADWRVVLLRTVPGTRTRDGVFVIGTARPP